MRAPLLIACLAVVGCGEKRPPRAPIPRATPTETLAPGDEIQIWVEGEGDVAARYRLAPDGTVEPRGCARIVASSKTPDALTAELRACVARAHVEPAVRVTVLSRDRRVTVFGQVQKPGQVPFARARTITEAIAFSGGFTSTAWTAHVRLERTIEGKRTVFAIDVKSILEGEEPDLELDAGDQLFVPERF